MAFDLQELLIKSATIDELLGPTYEPQIGQKDRTDHAALKLAAWCRSASSGDWGLFFKRINRGKLSIDQVLSRFAYVRHSLGTPLPTWFVDAQWVYQALTGEFGDDKLFLVDGAESRPFEKLFYALVSLAEAKVIEKTPSQALALFNDAARADLRAGLLKLLSDLYAPLLYSKFVVILKKHSPEGKLPASTVTAGEVHFDTLVEDLRTTELAEIFTDKPVLLRLTATIVRQWIGTTIELFTRLHADITEIRTFITHSAPNTKVQAIGGDLSDPHNFGHSVQILTFEDRTKLVYKPKDLRLDVAWYDLIVRFNNSSPPVDLKPVQTIACHDYGWTEFIDHTTCESAQDIELFYRRSGAWLAVFHLFASTDMHFENILSHGAHPVPIDLEMILQASTPEAEQATPETAALIEASYTVVNSVLMVGMLPSYAKSPNNKIFDAGGLNAVKSSTSVGVWKNANTDGMRWMQVPNDSTETPNIPHINGQYSQLGDYLPAFIEGFEQYSHFLLKQRDAIGVSTLLSPFKRLPVRKVIRNTRFYYMLLQRLKDHRNMGDGVTWSAQAEFLSRLADWDAKDDLLWPLQEAERIALVNLNVPHFVSPSDEDLVSAITGHHTQTGATPGLERAAERFSQWSALEIERQIEIIKVSTSFVSRSDSDRNERYLFKRKIKQLVPSLDQTTLAREATRIATAIQQHSTIKDKSAAWVGLDWLGASEVGQLVTLGPDLYNGTSGIALYLAAHARYANDSSSRDLAFKALASTRLQIAQPSAPRWARGLGIGGASGLGSVVYALTVISELLVEPSLLQDALTASNLFSNELITADRSLDVIAGSAGGVLGLLAVYRKTQSKEVLAKAITCGEHLLQQPRLGEAGKRSWVVLGVSESPLTGFSHGAAGFAYALKSLAKVSGREEFEVAAQECVAYEDSCYNKDVFNWPDLRTTDATVFPSQWCHGAVGIGLARAASSRGEKSNVETIFSDINRAVQNTTANWPQHVDTLCCGTLGTIEFLGEAGELLNQPALGHLSDQRLAQIIANRQEQGDYAWNAGGTAFNLGLFRGLSGVGYTILRKLDPQLPNVLMWE
ncbi:MAG: type 2 lanthipeptide synthetase LanM family protein [Burkholderiaceae bacterium]|nr:type 2 lanthipeptide synthetase LanM family protein [Burkholderiaceae bacterium]